VTFKEVRPKRYEKKPKNLLWVLRIIFFPSNDVTVCESVATLFSDSISSFFSSEAEAGIITEIRTEFVVF